MFNDYIDVRVYQAPPGGGRSKQLAPSGEWICGQEYKRGQCDKGH